MSLVSSAFLTLICSLFLTYTTLSDHSCCWDTDRLIIKVNENTGDRGSMCGHTHTHTQLCGGPGRLPWIACFDHLHMGDMAPTGHDGDNSRSHSCALLPHTCLSAFTSLSYISPHFIFLSVHSFWVLFPSHSFHILSGCQKICYCCRFMAELKTAGFTV